VEVCYGDTLQQALKMLPKGHKDRRDKAAKLSQKARQRPIQVGGQKFVNLNILRGKVKEILASRTDGEELKVGGPDYTLIRAVLDYHPSKDRKTAGMRGIKVDVSDHGSTRCFHVLREEGKGAPEDFSVKKCLEEIEKNPPYADVAKDTKDSKPESKEDAKEPKDTKDSKDTSPPADSKDTSPPADSKDKEGQKPEEGVKKD